MLMSILGIVSDNIAAAGGLLGGLGALIAATVAIYRAHAAAVEAAAEAKVSRQELKDALELHNTTVIGHITNSVTSSRVQTLRYVDRRLESLESGQETLLSLIADVDAKVTKKANTVARKPATELVSAETKGNY